MTETELQPFFEIEELSSEVFEEYADQAHESWRAREKFDDAVSGYRQRVEAAAATVSDNPQYPFFVDGKLSEHTDALMRVCADFEKERNRTQQFCEKVRELELLAPLRATHTPDGETEPQSLANYVAIDAEKLGNLPADVVHELHTSGFLSAMYLQLYSLENWRHLMARKLAKSK